MIRNYFTIAWRNLRRYKVFSAINIFGLAIGLSCCMLIALYIYHEISYDSYHQKGDRIYQLGTEFKTEGASEKGANTSAPLGRTMQLEFPEIEEQTRLLKLFTDDKTLLQYTGASGDRKTFYETKGYLADSNFFKVLTYFFKEGDPSTALAEPNTVVIGEDIAKKFFGNESAINRQIRISSSTNGDHDFKVTGVFKPSPAPSHIDARFIMSMRGGNMDGMANNNPSMINNNMFYTYLLLKKGADQNRLAGKFPPFVQKHLGEELKQSGKERAYFLTSLKKVYLRSDLTKNVTAGGSRSSLYILASIAVLTLLIACINFMNLSTSSSSRRAAEVGVRKVLGAEKGSLLRQFLGESLLMAGIALVFAIALTILLLPLFEQVSGKMLTISWQEHAALFGGFMLLAVFTGLLAGTYPAFYLSSFKPVNVLKGRFKNSLSAVSLRKGMVVFQFVISIALIIASLVIADQMKFMRSKDLGFTKDQQIVIPLRSATAKSLFATLKTTISGIGGVTSVGASLYYPGIFNPMDWMLYGQGQTKDGSKSVYINFVDYDFLKTLAIQPKAGRIFSAQFPSDTSDRFIINEEGAKQLGFSSPEAAIGKWVGFEPEDTVYRLEVVGVVKDFHFKDLHEKIQPYGFLLSTGSRFNYIIAHASGGDVASILGSVKKTWNHLNPNEPFEFSFLDQDFQKNYEAETRQAGLINSFTIIAIIISCLGLFGLATFSAEQRTKEIGIRKVLGASVAGVIALLTKDFLKLVVVAVCIASPLAWYGMNQWLQNFSYRIHISWQIYVFTAVLALFIAFITISFQALRSAVANPIKNLRTE
ncbi:MAG TPA: ABC transporter permease [Flavisolibacter sp.]|nr:ABC transporter permease [Flavisolibacter sp.]